MKPIYILNILKQVVTITMLAYLLWQLSIFIWLLVPVDPVNASSISNQQFQVSKTKLAKFDMKSVAAFNLFGYPKHDTNKLGLVEVKQIRAPETSLRFKLRGLRKGQGTIPSSAIIEDSRNVQDIYYLGDELPGSSKAIIYEIYSQRLILERNGKYETLTLFDVLQQKSIPARKQQENIQPTEVKEVEQIIPMIDKTRNEALTTKLSTIVDKLENSPLSLSGTMIINPVKDDNGFQGYSVAPGNDRLLFAHLGLKKGDIITSVNDVKLDSPGKIMSLMGILSSATDLEIEIMRGSQPLAYRYKVR